MAATANPDAIRALRIWNGTRPSALARAAGIDRVTLWRIEEGLQRPQPETIERIADALDVPLAAICLTEKWLRQ